MPTIVRNHQVQTENSCKREGSYSKTRLRADVAVPHRYRNRPSVIRVGIYRVWERAAEYGLTRATTAVLQSIIAAGVSVGDPFAPIFAKKATLARLAECSEVTVYRAMRQLEKDGWIRRTQQMRLEDGVLDIGLITITEKLVNLIGLNVTCLAIEPVTTTDSTYSNDCSDNYQSVVSKDEDCGSATDTSRTANPTCVEQAFPREIVEESRVQNDNSSGSMKDGLKDGPIYTGERLVYPKASVNTSPRAAEFVRMDGRSVARELVWLIAEGRLTYGQLFELQSLAKQAPGNQRLSDFVALRSHRLSQLATTNDCYRYLKSLITQQLDARYLCAQRSKSEHRVYRRKQRTEAVDTRNQWIRARHGCVFVNTTSGRTYEVNANHSLLNVGTEGRPSNEPCLKITKRFIRAVETGELVRFVPKSDRSSREESVSHIAAALQILKRRPRPIQQTCEG